MISLKEMMSGLLLGDESNDAVDVDLPVRAVPC